MNLDNLDRDPLALFLAWYGDAVKTGISFPDAVTLATATSGGKPSARVILYKGLQDGKFRFVTNYESRKGHELAANPYAVMVFYWSSLNRQIRVEGRVEKMSEQDSDSYWKSRPRESQISGFISPQSRVIKNRADLVKKVQEVTEKFKGREIPRPDSWGGMLLVPDQIEFWQGQDNRLHDRALYSKQDSTWRMEFLAP